MRAHPLTSGQFGPHRRTIALPRPRWPCDATVDDVRVDVERRRDARVPQLLLGDLHRHSKGVEQRRMNVAELMPRHRLYSARLKLRPVPGGNHGADRRGVRRLRRDTQARSGVPSSSLDEWVRPECPVLMQHAVVRCCSGKSTLRRRAGDAAHGAESPNRGMSGRTTVSNSRHSTNRDSTTRAIRDGLSARFGRMFRST